MLKSFKFKCEEDNIFFFSDFHGNHDRDFIYLRRGYNNVQDHYSGVLKAWNEVVNNTSIVFHLGDIIFKDSTGQGFRSLIHALQFKELYLLLGNHTSGQRQEYLHHLAIQHPGSVINGELQYEVYPLRVNYGHKTVIFLPEYFEASINSAHVVLCHYPIMSFNGDGKGTFHLCGHSHGNCKESHKDTGLGYRLDVGVESFGRPVSMTEVRQIFSKRQTHSFDHHGN